MSSNVTIALDVDEIWDRAICKMAKSFNGRSRVVS